jgi:transcriptional regulator with XRE-family HTH domain
MSALEERPLSEILKEELQDEDYRYAYDEEFANSRMATQIKVIREQQGLRQVELAELAEMKQSRISALEDVNYNSWSVSTLRRLARALGVRFAFGFESWGELLPEVDGFGRKALERPKFEDDLAFKSASSKAEGADEQPAIDEFEVAAAAATPARYLRLAGGLTATMAIQTLQQPSPGRVAPVNTQESATARKVS